MGDKSDKKGLDGQEDLTDLKGLKAYISVDLEGVNGILHSSQTQPNEPGYNRALKLMHDETNAAIEGLLEAGVKEIVVNDSHWDMRNLRIEDLVESPAVYLRSGWQKPFSMVSGLSEAERRPDFAIFLGYHARAGHPHGVLSHTYRAQIFFEVKLDGKPVGETGLNAALASYFGVPIAMLTGDDAVIEEARQWLGDLTFVQVKEAVSRYSAILPSHAGNLAKIRKAAKEAALNSSCWHKYELKPQSSIEITMFDPSMADAAELIPGIERLDARTIAIKHSDYSKAFRMMLAVGALGASRKDPYFS